MRALVPLGIAALFLGGALGGFLGAALLRAEPVRSAMPASAGPPAPDGRATTQGTSPGLAAALAGLTREVRSLRAAFEDAANDPGAREPAEGRGLDVERLTEVLEGLTKALSAGRRAGGPVFQPLVVPKSPPRQDLLNDLRRIEDDEARSKRHRFLTYQEVLNLFGPPDHVYDGGRWVFDDPSGRHDLEFNFEDGLLIHIY